MLVYQTEGEVRDGLGGGFMERQERVSKATVEVDEDGFDDFGRRSKKTKEDRRLKEEAALKRLQSSYGFLLPHDASFSTDLDNGERVSSSKDNKDNRNNASESVRRESNNERNRSDKDVDRKRDRGDSRNRKRNRSEDRRRDRSRSRSNSRRRHRR